MIQVSTGILFSPLLVKLGQGISSGTGICIILSPFIHTHTPLHNGFLCSCYLHILHCFWMNNGGTLLNTVETQACFMIHDVKLCFVMSCTHFVYFLSSIIKYPEESSNFSVIDWKQFHLIPKVMNIQLSQFNGAIPYH